MFQITGEPPDSEYYEKMNPFLRLWMYYNWRQDQVEKHEFTKDYSTFIGSFFNPEAAHKILNSNEIVATEQDDEAITEMLRQRQQQEQQAEEQQTTRRRRRRRKGVING